MSLWPPRLTGLRRLLQATVLRVELERAGIDHVHAHFATTAAGLASLARRMGGPTYSVTAHAKDIYHSDVRPERLREKLRRRRSWRPSAGATAITSPSLLGGRRPGAGRLELRRPRPARAARGERAAASRSCSRSRG